jgi:hypothetical protein
MDVAVDIGPALEMSCLPEMWDLMREVVGGEGIRAGVDVLGEGTQQASRHRCIV